MQDWINVGLDKFHRISTNLTFLNKTDILIPISIYFDQQNFLANLRDLLYHKVEKTFQIFYKVDSRIFIIKVSHRFTVLTLLKKILFTVDVRWMICLLIVRVEVCMRVRGRKLSGLAQAECRCWSVSTRSKIKKV